MAMENDWKKKKEDIASNFEFFDRDSNGTIDFNEFKSLLRVLSPDATTEQAEEGFSIIDSNGDGSIDLEEFAEWWKSTWWEF